jgi:hypothetical protein
MDYLLFLRSVYIRIKKGREVDLRLCSLFYRKFVKVGRDSLK